jgi:hypothetical protein
MNEKILYVVAAALALIAAAIYFFRAAPGEDVTLRVAFLVIMGVFMLWLGLRRKPTRPN